MQLLRAAALSASTSSHLQGWSVVEVEDPDQRQRVSELVGNQKQVVRAARFLAFCADHYRLRRHAEHHGIDPDGLGSTELLLVSAIDAALAAERLAVTAENLGIGICYIGSLRNDPAAIADLLKLPKGMFGLFGLCLGYPQENASEKIKPRHRPENTFHRGHYDANWDPTAFDERMHKFYEAEGMDATDPYSLKMAQRVTHAGLAGRHTMQDSLQKQGFAIY